LLFDWPPTEATIQLEICATDPAYFLTNFVKIERKAEGDELAGAWLPFLLWDAQAEIVDALLADRLFVMLKARQLGFSWIVLGYILWLMLFRPIATVLIFSKRDDEAVALLCMRLKGMHARLPEWLVEATGGAAGGNDQKHLWELVNGSRCMAMPTTGGRSYTGTFVLVDEADHVPDLQALLNAVKPTIDAGGQLVLLSSPDKSKPESLFKRIYLAGSQHKNEYRAIFYGWDSRPDRSRAWYEREKASQLANTGSLDDLHQEYPATPAEALSPRSLDKRIAPAWLEQCFEEVLPDDKIPFNHEPKPPAIPGLVVYRIHRRGARYVIGADPAEGNPTSDDSAITVLDVDTGEEVASLAGRLQPSVLGAYADAIGKWYNDAAIMVERNNHGHAVLLWLEEHSQLTCLTGLDGRLGWLSSNLGKVALYDATADIFRNQETLFHTFTTFVQLSSIEGSTLKAPEGCHDDRADSFALACVAMVQEKYGSSGDDASWLGKLSGRRKGENDGRRG
jgi:hypothetical protein